MLFRSVIGKLHLETLLLQGRDVVALCDIDTEKAKKVAERFGVDLPVYSDWREMIKAERPLYGVLPTEN